MAATTWRWVGRGRLNPADVGATHASPLRITALLAVVIAAASPAHAQPAAPDALSGLIVDEEADGARDLDAVPGVRAREPLPAKVEQRLRELTVQRDAVGVGSTGGAARVPAPALSGDVDAPPRVDSGRRDPDRLHSLPLPSTAR